MRLLRWAPLLLALSLLTSAATAHAEHAWVLWERWFSEGTGDSWTALGSEVSQWACNRASESEYAQAVRKGVDLHLPPRHRRSAWAEGEVMLFDALWAFFQEQQYCGDLDGGVEGDRVWVTCTCGAVINRDAVRD
jgi:hypothetical protein